MIRFAPNPFTPERQHGIEHEPSPESILFDAKRPRGLAPSRLVASAIELGCERCGSRAPGLEINNGLAGCLDCNLEMAVERATAHALWEPS